MLTRFRRLSRALFIPTVLAATIGIVTFAGKPSAAATGPRQTAALAAPAEAPLNPEYARYLARFPLGTPQWIASAAGFGERPAPVDFSYARGLSAPRALDRAYPGAYDLRALNKVTPVKDQNPYGTCWSFATMGSLESALMPAENDDFSEDNLVLTNGFDTGGTPAEQYAFGGNINMSTAYLTRWSGPVYETDDAYGDSLTPTGLVARKHVQDVSWFPMRASAADNDAIKYAVSTYGGCYVSMKWNGSSSGSPYYNAANAAYYDDGVSLPVADDQGHGVLVVGWDDDYPAANFATTPPGNGAFIVKNSWGGGWGDGGYFSVSYYDVKFARTSPIAVFNGVQPVTDYATVYQYDTLGYTQNIGYTSASAWFANVFTAQSTANLAAVGFYAVTPGTTYEVYTGSSLDAKVLSASSTLATMGFHTVTLPQQVRVTAGQPFIVAVKVTTTGYGYPIAVEQPLSGYSSGSTAAAGQSYISADGATWGDVTTWYAGTNVCLKAYTSPGPTTSVAGIPASGWSRTPITVNFTAAAGVASVSYTEFSLDGAAFAQGTQVVVGGTGTHTVAYRSADALGNVEATQTATVGIDPAGPLTVAYAKVAAKKGKTARFRFKVVDLTPTANVELRIYKGARLKKVLAAGAVKTGSVMIGTWKCTLAKGVYTWKVYATDLAGNAPLRIGKKTLVVK